ncbi:MAG: hypothetical protein J6U82_00660, partial [Alistipes sp.]|nr:hypothetical protein [Alistipes sp.]
MRYRLLLLSALAALCSLFACNEWEGEFGCSQLSYEVESITTTSVTLIATIDSSDYKAIDQMGFMVAVGDSTDFDLYPTAISRIIELKLDDQTPNTEYTFKSFVRAKGEEW